MSNDNIQNNLLAGKYTSTGIEEARQRLAEIVPLPGAPTLPGPERGHTPIEAIPYKRKDPKSIPVREWLYAKHYIRKFMSCTIAHGGVGKSSLVLTEALAMVTGKALLGTKTEHPRRVWYWNLEDPQDEIDRRIEGICKQYNISEEDMGDRLFVNSSRDGELCVAKTTREGTSIIEPVCSDLLSQIKARKIDVVIIDPFVASHEVFENDNGAMEAVANIWKNLADAGNCSVELVHHAKKTNSEAVTAESARGGSALVAKARDARCLNQMTESEAANCGEENRYNYFKVHSDKGNLAPRSATADWYQMGGVCLDNDPEGNAHDWVGVPSKWKWPDPFDDIPATALYDVQKIIHSADAENRRHNAQAKGWVGHIIAETLGLNPANKIDKNKMLNCLRTWEENGMLKKEYQKIEGVKKGEGAPVYLVGTWYTEAP